MTHFQMTVKELCQKLATANQRLIDGRDKTYRAKAGALRRQRILWFIPRYSSQEIHHKADMAAFWYRWKDAQVHDRLRWAVQGRQFTDLVFVDSEDMEALNR